MTILRPSTSLRVRKIVSGIFRRKMPRPQILLTLSEVEGRTVGIATCFDASRVLRTLRWPSFAPISVPAIGSIGCVPPALRPYIRLARLDRPIGTWLLLFPVLVGHRAWPPSAGPIGG